jgi:hypothetical protein
MSTPQNLSALIKEMQERARAEFITKCNRWRSDSGFMIDDGLDFLSMTEFLEDHTADTANATLEYVKGVAEELAVGIDQQGRRWIELPDLIARLTSNPQ